MSNELEVVAWLLDGCSYEVQQCRLPDGSVIEGQEPLVRLSDAQAEIAGLKQYAATIAAERDAALAKVATLESYGRILVAANTRHFDCARENYDDAVRYKAKYDAMAKELAEAKDLSRRNDSALRDRIADLETEITAKELGWSAASQTILKLEDRLSSLKAQSEPVA